MKKNILSKILISVIMVGIFLLPISPSLKIKNSKLLLTSNSTLVHASEENNKIMLNQGANTVRDTTADFAAIVLRTKEVTNTLGKRILNYPYVSPTYVKRSETDVSTDKHYMIVTVTEGSKNKAGVPDVTGNPAGYYTIPFVPNTSQQTLKIPLINLKPSTDYFFSASIFTTGTPGGPDGPQTEYENFTTTADPNTTASGGGGKNVTDTEQPQPLDLKCGVGGWFGTGSLYGCVAGLFWLAFELVSLLATLAAKFLDFFIYYSTSSTSYTSGFITKGWGAIRDVANIFFIIALLYIAIKTILSLNVSNNKKLIGTIIIIALLINFSLFFTQVIIDGSNILAKIFYNNIDQKYDNKKPAVGAEGEKSISVGLVAKFDPELLITQKEYDANGGTTTYIFLTIILVLILSYTAYMFFVVSLLFVSRVVMLWLSMIFAPIAFASYTLPFDIPGLGHKEWWKNLLENAFLAPLFIFMLYIIVMFTGFLSELVKYPTSSDLFQKIMAVVIPFIILFVLLMKSKDLAIKYAGEMGAAFNKAGAMVGGLAAGAALGGVGLLGRGLAGRAGSAMANSKWASGLANSDNKFVARLGRASQDSGEYLGKSTFDVRNTKLGEKAAKASGLDVGKASKNSEGGFEGVKKRKDEKRMAREKQLEDRQTKGQKGDIDAQESSINQSHNEAEALKNSIAPEINTLDKEIERLTKVFSEASQKAQVSGDPTDKTTALQASADLQNKKREMTSLKKAEKYDGDRDVSGAIIAGTGHSDYDNAKFRTASGNSINAMETKIIPDKERDLNNMKTALNVTKQKIRSAHADRIDSGFNKTVNFVTSMGVHSGKGASSTAKKLRRVERMNYSSGIPQP